MSGIALPPDTPGDGLRFASHTTLAVDHRDALHGRIPATVGCHARDPLVQHLTGVTGASLVRARTIRVEVEPLRSEAEIGAEARRSRARPGPAQMGDEAGPDATPRRRTNKTAVLAVMLVAMIALWAAGKMHSSRPTSPLTATHQPAAAHSGPKPRQPRRQASPSPSPSGRSPEMTPPPPTGFPNPSTITPAPGAGADASAAGVISVAPERSETPGVQIVAPAGEPGGTVGAAGAAPCWPRAAESAPGVTAVSAATSPGPAAPEEGSEQQSQQPAKAPSLQIGDQFTVTLLAPLAVSTAWQSVPAVARGVTVLQGDGA